MSNKLASPKQLLLQIFLAVIMAVVIWLPRGFELGKFVTTDEVAWLPRSANFYYALGQRDFAATQMNESPGITLMWVETAAYLIDFPQYRGFGQGFPDKYKFYEEILLSHNVHPLDILVTSRIIMLLLNTLVLAVAFFISLRIFGIVPSIFGFLLIAFDAYHTAVTRLAHLDAPMSSFLFLSVIAFLAYLLAGRKIWYLIISAAACALAVLAKIPAWVGVPTIGLLALLDYFVWQKRDHEINPPSNFLRDLVRPILIWGAVFILVIVLFYPAMWVKPLEAFKALALTPIGYATKIVNSPPVGADASLDTGEISFVFGDKPLNYIFRYPNYYYQTASPVILLGLIFALITYLFRKGALDDKNIRRGIQGLLLFALLYTIIMTVPPKSSPKYYVPINLVLDVIAGIGWVAAVSWLASLLQTRYRMILYVSLLGLVLAAQMIGTLESFPYYFTFYNPLVGGGKMFGSGEGLDQAAEYLNQKPNAQSLRALSWYGIGPFSYYFVGQSDTIPVGTYPWNDGSFKNLANFDYLVTYQNQWMRWIPVGLFEFLQGVKPEYTVVLNGEPYAKVYSTQSILEKYNQAPAGQSQAQP